MKNSKKLQTTSKTKRLSMSDVKNERNKEKQNISSFHRFGPFEEKQVLF